MGNWYFEISGPFNVLTWALIIVESFVDVALINTKVLDKKCVSLVSLSFWRLGQISLRMVVCKVGSLLLFTYVCPLMVN